MNEGRSPPPSLPHSSPSSVLYGDTPNCHDLLAKGEGHPCPVGQCPHKERGCGLREGSLTLPDSGQASGRGLLTAGGGRNSRFLKLETWKPSS